MLDLLLHYKEALGVAASVLIATLGLLTALVSRKKIVIYRVENREKNAGKPAKDVVSFWWLAAIAFAGIGGSVILFGVVVVGSLLLQKPQRRDPQYSSVPIDRVATAVSTEPMFSGSNSERLIFSKWGEQLFTTAQGQSIPFFVGDPKGGTVPNVIVLHSPATAPANTMPKRVFLPCTSPAKIIHLLGAVTTWAYPDPPDQTISMIVRLHYSNGVTEDHPLLNGVHICMFTVAANRPFPDLPGSKFAFRCSDFEGGARHVRYLAIRPREQNTLLSPARTMLASRDTSQLATVT